MTPVQRALAILRKGGATAAIVEKWVGFGKNADGSDREIDGRAGGRRDVWGFGDILAVRPEHKGALLLQVCGITGTNAHVRKMTEDPLTVTDPKLRKLAETRRTAALAWLMAGNRIEIWGLDAKRVRRFLVSYREIGDCKEVVAWETH